MRKVGAKGSLITEFISFRKVQEDIPQSITLP